MGERKESIQKMKDEQDKENKDDINRPQHYHSNGIDVIGFSEMQFKEEELKGFHRINAIKYLTRYDKKGTPIQDLRKAKFYIEKLIELETVNE